MRIVESPPPVLVPNVFGNKAVLFPWERDTHPKKEALTVDIPKEWAAFFLSMLQSPAHFTWAKEFIMSGASAVLSASEKNTTIPSENTTLILVPVTCPPSSDWSCLKLTDWSPLSAEEEEIVEADMEVDPSQFYKMEEQIQEKVTPNKNKKARILLVETEVRRSNRLKIRNKGFKTSSCGKASCLGCLSKPPTLSTDVNRNLGTELCQMDPNELTDEILLKKRDAKPIGTKVKVSKGKKTNKKKKDEDKNN